MSIDVPTYSDPGNGFDETHWHALLHDLRGCLGGMKATLDMRDPAAGVDLRDAVRLETGIREGLVLVELSRALAFGPWPSGDCEPVDAWRRGLEPEIAALAAMYRGRASLTVLGDGPWPGLLLRSFTLSLAKLLIPQAMPETLCVEADGRGDKWILTFRPVMAPPLALLPQGKPRDLHGIWVKTVAHRCGMEVDHAEDALVLSIPKHPQGLPPVE